MTTENLPLNDLLQICNLNFITMTQTYYQPNKLTFNDNTLTNQKLSYRVLLKLDYHSRYKLILKFMKSFSFKDLPGIKLCKSYRNLTLISLKKFLY